MNTYAKCCRERQPRRILGLLPRRVVDGRRAAQIRPLTADGIDGASAWRWAAVNAAASRKLGVILCTWWFELGGTFP